MTQTSLENGLPSPATSARSPASTVGGSSTSLPLPRSHPLKPGSSKEAALINYIDDRILRITRRYAKKFSNSESDGDVVPGYTNFDQVLHDLEPVFDVVWISGTPSVQTPYTLSLAGFFGSYMRAFPLTVSMFNLASKFDLAFSNLLKMSEGRSRASHGISITEKVRIKSLVEDTRVNAVRIASAAGIDTSLGNSSDSSSDGDDGIDDDGRDEHSGEQITLANGTMSSKEKVARKIAKIYELTIEILGDTIGSTTLPAMTDDVAEIAEYERQHEDEVIDL